MTWLPVGRAPASDGSRRRIFWRTCHGLALAVRLLRGSARTLGGVGRGDSNEVRNPGPLKVSLSKSGVGYSIGSRGYCVGQEAKADDSLPSRAGILREDAK